MVRDRKKDQVRRNQRRNPNLREIGAAMGQLRRKRRRERALIKKRGQLSMRSKEKGKGSTPSNAPNKRGQRPATIRKGKKTSKKGEKSCRVMQGAVEREKSAP